jgi:hypothetical protein
MNPLKQEQIRLLDAINCKDLRCKIDEIVKKLNSLEEKPKITGTPEKTKRELFYGLMMGMDTSIAEDDKIWDFFNK